MSINCPECNHTKTNVFDSRPYDGGVFRRRVCRKCEYQFYTMEKIQTSIRSVAPPKPADKPAEPVRRKKIVTKKRKPFHDKPKPEPKVQPIIEPVVEDIPDVDRMTDEELDDFIYGPRDRFDDDDLY